MTRTITWTPEQLADHKRKMGGVPIAVEDAPPPTAHKTTEPESELQARCESWLTWRGYAKRTPKHMQAHQCGRWQCHFHQPQGNPLMPDLLLIDSERGRCLEIELKVKGGRLSPDQQAMAWRGEWLVAWSLKEMQALVVAWEDEADIIGQ